jgi:hypothetical protein
LVADRPPSLLALWAHPRSRSSAFCRMMHERGDYVVKDEPFARYYYFSDERVSLRRPEVVPRPEYRFETILGGLWREAADHPVFVKDHAYHVISRADREFLSSFHSTFLIRHPAHSLPSLYALMPDFTLDEMGYAESLALFELAAEASGETPIVIDADDLVDRPEATVEAYCEAVGIPFDARALVWEEGIPAAMDADWGGWYAHLEQSRGFGRSANVDYVSVGDRRLAGACEIALPYYEQLYQHRLRVS